MQFEKEKKKEEGRKEREKERESNVYTAKIPFICELI